MFSVRTLILGLLAWLAVSFSAAALGAFASANAGTFYLQLSRPPWAPPAWLFAPVWSLLYLLIRPLAGVLLLPYSFLIANQLFL